MSLPAFLGSLSSGGTELSGAIDSGRAVKIIIRVCRIHVFRLPLFPRTCLRQSLALCQFLRGTGYALELHLGVCKGKGDEFKAHSWVTYRGEPVADRVPEGTFRTLFSYPVLARGTEAVE